MKLENQQIELRSISLVIVLSLLICASVGAGEIYQWVDENGVTHFGDNPPASSEYTTPEVKINSYTSAYVEDNLSTTGSSANTVVMYGTSWCTYCKKAKTYFEAKGIKYREYDIEKSPSARRQYDKLDGRGVPVILVGDKRMNGFSVEAFERIYY